MRELHLPRGIPFQGKRQKQKLAHPTGQTSAGATKGLPARKRERQGRA
jgi:hypothetical protein